MSSIAGIRNPFGLSRIGLAILTVMLIVCSDMFGLSMVIPVQAMYATALGTTTQYIGVIGSAFSACSFLSSLVMGKVSDAYGRRITFLVTGLGATLAYAGAIFAHSFYGLLMSRALAGLLSGTVGNAFAYLADITTKEERPIYMSYMSAVMSSCLIFGPMIGGGLAVYGLRYPYLGATLFAAGVVVLTFTSLQEPDVLLMKKSDRETDDDVETGRVLLAKEKSFKSVYGSTPASFSSKSGKDGPAMETTPLAAAAPTAAADIDNGASTGLGPWTDSMALLVGGLCNFLHNFAFFGAIVCLPLLLMEPSFDNSSTHAVSIGHRWLQEEMPGTVSSVSVEAARRISLTTGYLVGVNGVIRTAGALVLFPFMVTRLGQLQTATIGALCLTFGLLVMPLASSVWLLMPCLMAMALGSCLVSPVITSQLSQLAPPGKNAEYLSFNGTFSSLATMCSGFVTFLYAGSKFHALGLTTLSAFLLAIVLGGLAYDEVRKAVPPKDKEQNALEKFFGFGQELPQERFFDELQIALIATIRERGWSRGMKTKKGQMILLELLIGSVPQLPTEFSEKMEAINEIYRRTGHEDWAKEHAEILSLRGVVPDALSAKAVHALNDRGSTD